MDDWHATKLVDHVVTTLGKAILLGTAIAVVGALVAGATGDTMWAAWAGVLATVAVGGVLYLSQAPAPTDVDVDADSS